MSRSLIDEYLFIDDSQKNELKFNPSEPARLSVLADSAETELYILNRTQIHFIEAALRVIRGEKNKKNPILNIY